ncbi:MAG: hypothetical protein ACYS21_08310, partial [Planctomycetota bacterium]
MRIAKELNIPFRSNFSYIEAVVYQDEIDRPPPKGWDPMEVEAMTVEECAEWRAQEAKKRAEWPQRDLERIM